MRFPRFLFAALTLVICLLLDFALGKLHLSTSYLNPESLAAGSVQEIAPAQMSPVVENTPPPKVSPPSFKAPTLSSAYDKAQGLLPPPVLTPPPAGALAMLARASFSELPEPQFNKTGLLLLDFADASLFCSKQNKRLPTILDVAKWAAHNGALVASIADAQQLGRATPENAIYLQRGAQTQSIDFYFDKDRFAYPAKRPVTNAAIWTSDERPLGGPAKASHYAFSLYSASFSPVPTSSSLAVICLDKNVI